MTARSRSNTKTLDCPGERFATTFRRTPSAWRFQKLEQVFVLDDLRGDPHIFLTRHPHFSRKENRRMHVVNDTPCCPYMIPWDQPPFMTFQPFSSTCIGNIAEPGVSSARNNTLIIPKLQWKPCRRLAPDSSNASSRCRWDYTAHHGCGSAW